MVLADMLMLLFRVAESPWAIAAAEVKDLISLVTLQPFFQGTDVQDAGCRSERFQSVDLLNYHSERLPVVDVSSLLGYERAPEVLSTRIAIVEVSAEPDTPQEADNIGASIGKRLGLILDRAYETTFLVEEVDVPVPSPYVQAAYVGTNGLLVKRLAIAPLIHRVVAQNSQLQTHLEQPEQSIIPAFAGP